mmetsp:Transcript_3912/g.11359  ORF Transcript_3912/g.11359 Transcript_3912/m.11359 type:complete len:349 (+) Transcript_3912:187-1233(+)|eukprot:CAMPEP_0206144536 /NCGR_PEP_ID=MMETSP1473-20131121/24424_1 /ASSEMBLY_ACC=CAM_ASM_001109 /TAXON_ID=1461547 /ORGANISM="Stichococcus sp, Strain RCC1054" /LENGTH=348 /DNA_ID=CAMNT_0053540381 /DNA_START=164 /DNA_END=1210 /DNA_ORIENTATION=-
MDYYRRNKRKIWGAAAVGAAGAAAYYTYKWWTEGSSLEEILQRHVDGATGGAAQQTEQEALQQHFVSIQHIPEQKTLPTLLPSLQAALLRAADTTPLKEQLRQMRGDRTSGGEKVEVWMQLTAASFALAATTAWALPLLDLLLRVQINVLGRRLYFASLEEASKDGPPPLTQAEQHNFLGNADTLARQGVPQLVEAMLAVVQRVVGPLELGQAITPPHAMSLLADIHTGFEADVGGKGWSGFLLPPDDPTATAQVAEMVAEVRSIIASPAFALALQGAVQQAAAALAQAVAAPISPEGLPLARVVPLTEAASGALLVAVDNPVVAATGQLPAVAELCAFAYAPATDDQ